MVEYEKKSKVGLYIGIGIGVLLLGGGLFFALSDSKPQRVRENPNNLGNFDNTP